MCPSRKECAAFSSHPELLSLLPYVESLEDNEAITASGLCTYSIIHDLKNKAVFEAAAAGQQTATTKATTTTTTPIQQVTFTIFPVDGCLAPHLLFLSSIRLIGRSLLLVSVTFCTLERLSFFPYSSSSVWNVRCAVNIGKPKKKKKSVRGRRNSFFRHGKGGNSAGRRWLAFSQLQQMAVPSYSFN